MAAPELAVLPEIVQFANVREVPPTDPALYTPPPLLDAVLSEMTELTISKLPQ